MSVATTFGMVVLATAFILSLPTAAVAFENGRLSFSISFQEITSDLATISTVVQPSESLRIQTFAKATADQGQLRPLEGGGLHWTAPAEPGLATLRFQHAGATMQLHVFVATPFRNGIDLDLKGFRIGAYAPRPFRDLVSYKAPTGLVEMRPSWKDLPVSPHFRLGQFLCKQQPGHRPRYLLIRPALLLKLERLLEAANLQGWEAETFHVMSGFRTPFYNASIGNKTTSSRHLFGGAADVYPDADGDGVMDDLNRDGRVDTEDARSLAALAERLASRGAAFWPPGGLAAYPATSAHGPFVHVDARGYRARWGQ